MRHCYAKRIVLILSLFCLVVPLKTIAQELSPERLSPGFRWDPEDAFAGFLKKRVSALEVGDKLNIKFSASVTAVPMNKSPVGSIQELAKKGRIIGGLYIGTGSRRLNLPPGVYAVHIEFDSATFTWKARVLDKNGKPVRRVNAQVTQVKEVETPIAYVDRSVCYHFDKLRVCF